MFCCALRSSAAGSSSSYRGGVDDREFVRDEDPSVSTNPLDVAGKNPVGRNCGILVHPNVSTADDDTESRGGVREARLFRLELGELPVERV